MSVYPPPPRLAPLRFIRVYLVKVLDESGVYSVTGRDSCTFLQIPVCQVLMTSASMVDCQELLHCIGSTTIHERGGGGGLKVGSSGLSLAGLISLMWKVCCDLIALGSLSLTEIRINNHGHRKWTNKSGGKFLVPILGTAISESLSCGAGCGKPVPRCSSRPALTGGHPNRRYTRRGRGQMKCAKESCVHTHPRLAACSKFDYLSHFRCAHI